MKTYPFILLCLAIGLLASSGFAQNMYSGNPADPAMLESGFANPALNAYIKDRLVLAMTSHHVGVAGGLFSIRSGLISYHLPWQIRGAAVAAQFMKVGLYTQNDFRVSYGRRVYGPISAGANIDVFTRGFDRSAFVMFDERDPVFAGGTNKTSMSLGLGMTVEPYRGMILGFSIEHLNQPDLALGSELFRQSMMASLGLKWHLRGFNATSAVTSLPLAHYSLPASGDAANRLFKYTGGGIDIPVGRASLRAASDASAAQIEAEIPLYEALYVNYRYSYPTTTINVASLGTHRFGFVFDFNRLPPLPAMPFIPALPAIHTEVRPLGAPPSAMYYVYANTDSANVMKLHVRRNVENGISNRSLALVFPEDLGSLKAAQNPTPLKELNPLKVRDPLVRPRGYYSTNYRSALEDIGQQLRGGKSRARQEVISFPGTEKRANALVNALTGDHLAVQTSVPIFTTSSAPLSADSVEKVIAASEDVQRIVQPEQAIFHLVPMFQGPAVDRWSLEIRSAREAAVCGFSGTGSPPDSVAWNWQDSKGQIVSPGLYYYLLKAVDGDGRVTYSDRGKFEVIHRSRSLSIDVTRRSRVGDVDADKYILIVGSERVPFETPKSDTTRVVPQ
ncbi:MAG TPA: hypothetical protein VGL38_13910 [bacterium]|jgi:hypothetical protein